MNKLLGLLLLINIHFISFSQSWQDVGGGTNNSSHGMLVWNGKLVNLGSYNNPCNRVATWDGTQWECLGGGVGIVARAGCVWNGNLVVVGDFWNNFQPCTGCNGVAMWDGTQWTAFDQGFNNDVLTCTVYNGDLIIGGDFTEANGIPINRVARWNETTQTFESMGAVTDMDNDVRCMTVFEGELWVGGDFNNIGGQGPLDGLVKWDETSDVWVGGNSGVDLIGGVNETVRVLYVNPNDGNLYMGGEFLELWDGDAAAEDFNMAGVAMYDGSNWYPLGTGLNEYCRAIHEYNGDLIVGGYFTSADGVACNKIAKWNTTTQTFSPMGQGFDGVGIDEYVKSAAVWNGIFFAGGAYTQAEGGPMNYIAQWYEPTTSAPTAAFSPSATSGCEGACINFVDNSTNAPTSWNWTFPGASTTTSTDQNPTNICYPTSGTYTATLQACNSNGCTTADIDIAIGVAYNLSENIDACQNSLVTYPDGTTETITTSTSHTSNLTAISGCDSIIVTNVAMITQYNTSENVTICENTSYTYPDGSSELISSNTSHSSSLVSSLGCDSIVVTNVTMAVISSTNEIVQVCENSTVTYPDGTSETVTANTSHTSLLSSIWGCDSTVVTSVTVNPLYNTSEAISVCGNTSITYPDGTTEMVTGNTSHTSSLSSINGCDSTVVTNVTFNNIYSQSQSEDVCSGSSYTYPDGTVHSNITANESYSSNLTTIDGCDSIVTINLNVVTAISTSQNISLCSGDNYTYPDGSVSTNLQVNETHVSTLQSAFGCDSVITTNITVTTSPTLTANSETICAGETATLTATPSINGGSFLWLPDMQTTGAINVSPTSTTNYTATYSVNGCESNQSVATVSVNPMPNNTVSESNNVITATQTGALYTWLDCTSDATINGENGISYAPTANGDYAVIIDLNGCVDTSNCILISTISIDEFSTESIEVYPNPSINEIQINGLPTNCESIEIIDALGKRVYIKSACNEDIIDISTFEKGVYFLKINNGDLGTYRVVKQ